MIELILICLSFVIGYTLGRLNLIQKIEFSNLRKSTKRIKHSKLDKSIENISIDESKFVTNIQTSNLVKSYNNLGETTSLEKSDITASAQKLNQLKK